VVGNDAEPVVAVEAMPLGVVADEQAATEYHLAVPGALSKVR
jgi:hypothetical protein